VGWGVGVCGRQVNACPACAISNASCLFVGEWVAQHMRAPGRGQWHRLTHTQSLTHRRRSHT
jgi:hypothetical protein